MSSRSSSRARSRRKAAPAAAAAAVARLRATFDEIDADGSDSIGYSELRAALRRRDDVQLPAALQPGARGEIVPTAKNAMALRRHASEPRPW